MNRRRLRSAVVRALRERFPIEAVAEAIVAEVQTNLRTSQGGDVPLAPLWADNTPMTTPSGLEIGESYRKGGTPLVDTGHGLRSISCSGKVDGTGVLFTVLAPAYMVAQHHGFESTPKRNRKANRRKDGSLRNPALPRALFVPLRQGVSSGDSGLEMGVDFILLGKASIPARPFGRLGVAALRRLAQSIAEGLRRRH